jgi:hypothetical protein
LFVGKASTLEYIKGAQLGYAPALLTHIRLGCRGFP